MTDQEKDDERCRAKPLDLSPDAVALAVARLFTAARDDVFAAHAALTKSLADAHGAAQFMARAVAWYVDPVRHMWLYKMFTHVFVTHDALGFMQDLRSFAINALLGDSYWDVRWEKTRAGADFMPVFIPGGGMEVDVVTRDDQDARPVIYHASDGYKPEAVLLELMDEMERREVAHMEEMIRFDREMCGDG